MAPAAPRIAIVGAGPVGLTLAAILHRHGIQSSVLEAAGLLPAFTRIARYEGEAVRIVKKDGTVLLDENEKDDEQQQAGSKEKEGGEGEGEAAQRRGRPELDRRDLKDLLIKALPEGMVRWGRGVAAVEPVEGSKTWTLSFMNTDNHNTGTPEESESGPYDLVLGADGAWSRVRPLLTDARPQYSGISALEIWISAARLAARPDIQRFIGQGGVMMMAQDRFLSMQRHGDGSARTYACVRTSRAAGAPVPDTQTLLGLAGEVDWADETTRKRFLDRHFGDYDPTVRELVLAMTEQPCLRHLYMLPVGHRWAPRPGVSLLGDAAHVMTPFAGVGVNVGMMDALELAEGLAAHVRRMEEEGGVGEQDAGEALARVLRAYEDQMFVRASRDAAFTAKMVEIEFQDDGCESMARAMTGGGFPD